MAKLVGMIGTGSGRVGNVVLSKGPNGSTISRAYQPVVANPRTDGQLDQRAKMNLVGRISKIVPAGAISGLSMGSVRNNRSEFTKTMLDAAVVTMVSGARQASIVPEKVVFSHGSLLVGATMGAVTLTANTISVAFTNAIADMKNGVRLVAIVMNPDVDGYYRACAYQDFIFEASTGTLTMNLVTPLEEGEKINLYVCPFVLTDRKNGVKTSQVWFSEDYKADLGLTVSPNGVFGESFLGGSSVFTQG